MGVEEIITSVEVETEFGVFVIVEELTLDCAVSTDIGDVV